MPCGKNKFWLYPLFVVYFSGAAAAHAAGAHTAKKAELVGPEYLLHSGARSVLMEDVNQHGIAQDVWDKFIMAGDGNYDGLPSFRRGLYGVVAGDLSLISLYGYDQWVKGREDWVMIVHLKDECRQKSSVVENYEVISDEPPVTDPFTIWLYEQKKEKTLIPETMEPCLEAGIQKFWNVGTFYSLNKADEKTKQRSRTCGGVVHDFLDQTGAKLVTDPVNGEPYDNASWAIRDRSCIEDITGTPEDLFQAVFLGKLNKHRTPIDLFGAGSIKPYNRPSATLLLMINIFGEAPGFLTADWNHVVRTFMTKTGFQYTDQLLPGFNEEPHSIRNVEFEVVGYYLLNYTAGCAKKNRLVELQGLYKSYADWYFARNNKICGPRDLNDPVCRWGSVPAMAGDGSRPDLTDWDHVSSVLSLLKEVKGLCVSSR